MSYDTECKKLALHFLSDYEPVLETTVIDLAQAIQNAVEEWFEDVMDREPSP